MKAYPHYKDAGLPWISSIPEHWKITRAKYLYKKENRPVLPDDEVVTCFRDGTVTLRKNRRTTGFTEALQESGYQGIRKGDLVIHIMDAFAGASGVSDSDGKGTPVYNVCTALSDSNNYYYAHILRIMAKSGFIQSLYRGIRERSSDFRFEVFARQYLPVPPRAEQDQIVHYLDWQVSKINKLIEAKKKQIELLREHQLTIINKIVTCGLNGKHSTRYSGIDYLGCVPGDWLVLLNHRLFRSVTRKFSEDEVVLSLSQKDGLIPYEEMQERSLHTSSYDNWQLVLPNDLVLNRFKAHLGVFFGSKYRGIVTFHYGVYEAKLPINAKFYEALYHTPEYRRVFAGQSRGMTVGLQNLSDTNFYSVYTVYPSLEEQNRIVEVIDKVEKRYNALIGNINKEISMYNELRSRLISDVVTGQVDVRGLEVPTFEYVDDNGDTDVEADITADDPTEEV